MRTSKQRTRQRARRAVLRQIDMFRQKAWRWPYVGALMRVRLMKVLLALGMTALALLAIESCLMFTGVLVLEPDRDLPTTVVKFLHDLNAAIIGLVLAGLVTAVGYAANSVRRVKRDRSSTQLPKLLDSTLALEDYSPAQQAIASRLLCWLDGPRGCRRILMICGPSGCGKSALMDCMTRLLVRDGIGVTPSSITCLSWSEVEALERDRVVQRFQPLQETESPHFIFIHDAERVLLSPRQVTRFSTMVKKYVDDGQTVRVVLAVRSTASEDSASVESHVQEEDEAVQRIAEVLALNNVIRDDGNDFLESSKMTYRSFFLPPGLLATRSRSILRSRQGRSSHDPSAFRTADAVAQHCDHFPLAVALLRDVCATPNQRDKLPHGQELASMSTDVIVESLLRILAPPGGLNWIPCMALSAVSSQGAHFLWPAKHEHEPESSLFVAYELDSPPSGYQAYRMRHPRVASLYRWAAMPPSVHRNNELAVQLRQAHVESGGDLPTVDEIRTEPLRSLERVRHHLRAMLLGWPPTTDLREILDVLDEFQEREVELHPRLLALARLELHTLLAGSTDRLSSAVAPRQTDDRDLRDPEPAFALLQHQDYFVAYRSGGTVGETESPPTALLGSGTQEPLIAWNLVRLGQIAYEALDQWELAVACNEFISALGEGPGPIIRMMSKLGAYGQAEENGSVFDALQMMKEDGPQWCALAEQAEKSNVNDKALQSVSIGYEALKICFEAEACWGTQAVAQPPASTLSAKAQSYDCWASLAATIEARALGLQGHHEDALERLRSRAVAAAGANEKAYARERLYVYAGLLEHISASPDVRQHGSDWNFYLAQCRNLFGYVSDTWLDCHVRFSELIYAVQTVVAELKAGIPPSAGRQPMYLRTQMQDLGRSYAAFPSNITWDRANLNLLKMHLARHTFEIDLWDEGLDVLESTLKSPLPLHECDRRQLLLFAGYVASPEHIAGPSTDLAWKHRGQRFARLIEECWRECSDEQKEHADLARIGLVLGKGTVGQSARAVQETLELCGRMFPAWAVKGVTLDRMPALLYRFTPNFLRFNDVFGSNMH